MREICSPVLLKVRQKTYGRASSVACLIQRGRVQSLDRWAAWCFLGSMPFHNLPLLLCSLICFLLPTTLRSSQHTHHSSLFPACLLQTRHDIRTKKMHCAVPWSIADVPNEGLESLTLSHKWSIVSVMQASLYQSSIKGSVVCFDSVAYYGCNRKQYNCSSFHIVQPFLCSDAAKCSWRHLELNVCKYLNGERSCQAKIKFTEVPVIDLRLALGDLASRWSWISKSIKQFKNLAAETQTFTSLQRLYTLAAKEKQHAQANSRRTNICLSRD